MGQNWKTLSAVVVGAAVMGWFVVRMLTAAPSDHAPAGETTAPAPIAPSPAAVAAATAGPTAAPIAPRATARAAAGRDDTGVDVAVIARDLELLSQALVRDQRPEDRVLPRINDALDVPGVTAYRRAPDFWEPAFASSEGANR